VKFKRRNVMDLANLICGNVGVQKPTFTLSEVPAYFLYRSSMHLTEFFQDLDTDWRHDGTPGINGWPTSSRTCWPNHTPAPSIRRRSSAESSSTSWTPPTRSTKDPSVATPSPWLTAILTKEGFEAFYGDDRHCYLRDVRTRTIGALQANPHRPLTVHERQRRKDLEGYLDRCSEDELIEEVLLPLLRQLGFHRITAAGHKDKALEYGKDVWMRYTLPTQHYLYFGVQAKKGQDRRRRRDQGQ
jgi:hypothetical protein